MKLHFDSNQEYQFLLNIPIADFIIIFKPWFKPPRIQGDA
jgi:hypothetical protein